MTHRKLGIRTTTLVYSAVLTALSPLAWAEAGDENIEVIQIRGEAISKGYTSGEASIGSKGVASIKETPHSISVVTEQRIQDQRLIKLDDALGSVNGARVMANNQGRSSVLVRGYELDEYLIDGLSVPLSSLHGNLPDMAMFERVEVMKGPAGLFGGTGEPGGTVNLIRKRGKEEFDLSTSATLGSWNTRAFMLDVTDALTADKSIRGRFVYSMQDRESFVDVVAEDTDLFYGVLDFSLTDNTELSISFNRETKDMVPSNGVPTYTNTAPNAPEYAEFIDLPRSTFYGSKDNYFTSTANDLFIGLEHWFSNSTKLKFTSRVSQFESDFEYLYSYAEVPKGGNQVELAGINMDYEQETKSFDLHLVSLFELNNLTSSVVIGVDYRNDDTLQERGNGSTDQVVDLFNPNHDLARATYRTTLTDAHPVEKGLYIQSRLNLFEDAIFVLGGRLASFEKPVIESNARGSTAQEESISGQFIPNLGFVYNITDEHSFYMSHSEIFSPHGTLDPETNEFFAPRESKQFEIGLKSELAAGAINATVNYFDLVDTNNISARRTREGIVYTPLRDTEIHGAEFEVSGNVFNNLEVYAGYSFTRTKFRADALRSAVYSTATPKHQFSSIFQYTLAAFGLPELRLGYGFKFMSDFYSDGYYQKVMQPSYAVHDLYAKYSVTKHVDIALKVNNLTDKHYYNRVGVESLFNFFGEPRNYSLTASYHF
ncbi:TonB-dependent siderophore receptor [Pseudoalteromonas fenneropenaei]|uniref:TonB-dependent siderophore receptor n=1 Tax=Pseudoalteromonas fenneropenaei TaxID=1737459 RepID=A0ABV7CPQ4_9GAMM